MISPRHSKRSPPRAPRLLHRDGRAKDCRGGQRGRRAHDHRRSRQIPRPRARARARTYRGYTVVSMPPPSSGGAHIIEILNILEGFPIRAQGHNSAASLHELAEAEKLAYADRAAYLGDPDFIKIPLAASSPRPTPSICARSSRPTAPAQLPTFVRTSPSATRAIRRRISRSSMTPATRSPTRTPSIFLTGPAWLPKGPGCCSTMSSTISPPSRERPTPTVSWAATPMRRDR